MSHPRSPDALNHLTAEAATSDSRPPNAATRREIRFTHHDDCEAAALVLEHVAAEQVPHLFVRSGQLVRLVSVDERVRIEVLSRDRLTAHLGEHYYLTKIERDKKEQVKQLAGPWPRLVNQLLHRGQWPELPSLRAVSKTPCYSPSWDLMRQRGYHEQAQLFLDLDLLETTSLSHLEMWCGISLLDARTTVRASGSVGVLVLQEPASPHLPAHLDAFTHPRARSSQISPQSWQEGRAGSGT